MPLTLQRQLEKGNEIWVRNMTDQPPSTVALNFKYNGADALIKVPPGRYPFRLYPGVVSHDMITHGGSQLQMFLNNGALKLVSRKRANTMLKEPGAKEEQTALFSRANNAAAAQKWARKIKRQSNLASANPDVDTQEEYFQGPPGLPDVVKNSLLQSPLDALKERLAENGEGPSHSRHQLALSGADPQVNPRVLGIMTQWNPTMDEGVLNQLRSMRSSLKLADVNYVMRSAQRNSRTWKWVKELADKMGF